MEYLDSLKPIFELLLGKYGSAPQVVGILFFVQSFNKVMQKVYPLIKSLVEATPTDKDDALLKKAEGSDLVKVAKWLVDFLLRVKL